MTPIGRAVIACSLCLSAAAVQAQPKLPKHYLYSSEWPPGAIGRLQLERGGPMRGYFQPVEVTGPKGSLITASNGLTINGEAPTNVVRSGMQIGHAYRLKVGNIKFREGAEVYPTIEIINRLYPPPGQETHFPIPIELTEEELQMAVDGRFVTRVIYLEDPQTAIGIADEPTKQRYFEVGRQDDPLEIADRMGRPMAVLRMGSRIPSREADPGDVWFPYEQPPTLPYEKAPVVARRDGLEHPHEQPRPQARPQVIATRPGVAPPPMTAPANGPSVALPTLIAPPEVSYGQPRGSDPQRPSLSDRLRTKSR